MKQLPFKAEATYSDDLAAVMVAMRAGPRRKAVKRAYAIGVEQAALYARTKPVHRALLSSQLDTRQRDAFLHCWHGRTRPVAAIRKRVLQWLPRFHQGRCPYCALIAEVETLDHFCGKASLPELCLYDRNLVPSCYTCNNKRLESFGAEGQRVIHFYDDDVDGIPDVLVARIDEDRSAIVAKFELRQPVSEAAALYERHFKALKLGSRYSRWAATAMRDSITADLPVSDTTACRAGLLRIADRLRVRWGNNEPQVALARGLAERADLIPKVLSS